jgi:hypothetical protein
MLSQLAYMGNRETRCTQQGIEKISALRRKNPALTIASVLLSSDTRKLQNTEFRKLTKNLVL